MLVQPALRSHSSEHYLVGCMENLAKDDERATREARKVSRKDVTEGLKSCAVQQPCHEPTLVVLGGAQPGLCCTQYVVRIGCRFRSSTLISEQRVLFLIRSAAVSEVQQSKLPE